MVESNVVVVQEMAVPRLLSPVMRGDLRRAAQRMIDRSGCVLIRPLHKRLASRIPGTIEQYSVTIAQLLNRRELKFNGRRRTPRK